MTDKLYQGIRTNHTPKVFVDNVELSLEPSKILHPSDATVEWAYFGDGPSQTALAILFDATQDSENSLKYYQDFKFDFIANASYEGFSILESQVIEWLEFKIKAEKGPSNWGDMYGEGENE